MVTGKTEADTVRDKNGKVKGEDRSMRRGTGKSKTDPVRNKNGKVKGKAKQRTIKCEKN